MAGDKKPAGKPAAKAAAPQAKTGPKSYRVASCYTIEGGKIVSRNPYSPKLGPGYFMGVHKDRVACGQTGYMEKKASK